jgi:hypothetical protein
MEIIDAHVHIGRRHLPMEKIQEILDRADVDRAVVFADPESANIVDDNNYVLEVTSKNNHIPFFYIGGNAYSSSRCFPQLPDPEVLDPYMGIKWHCWFTPGHDFGGTYLGMDDNKIEEVLTEPRMKAIMDYLQERNIPINFEEHFDVTVMFADLYPDVTIIIPHMGGLNGGADRVLAAVGNKENVRFDVSLAGISEGLVREYGAHKFLCGSDYPYGSPSWSVDRCRKLNVSDEEREAIMSGNILSITGLT